MTDKLKAGQRFIVSDPTSLRHGEICEAVKHGQCNYFCPVEFSGDSLLYFLEKKHLIPVTK